jgi:hypothetical protein
MTACILPACAIEKDGVLKYDAGDSGKIAGTYGMRPWGHAVLFKNNAAITITGIQVYGCKFGSGSKSIFVEIWDKDLKLLYRDPVALDEINVGKMDPVANNCGKVASWADIPLPNHAVSGDFYIAVFTYSPKPSATEQGMSIGYTTPSSTTSSHTVKENPNIIDEITIGQQYNPSQIDWMIRTLYKKSAATTTTTPVSMTVSLESGTVPAPSTLAGSPASGQSPEMSTPGAPISTAKPESTKAGIGLEIVVLSLAACVLLWKKS